MSGLCEGKQRRKAWTGRQWAYCGGRTCAAQEFHPSIHPFTHPSVHVKSSAHHVQALSCCWGDSSQHWEARELCGFWHRGCRRRARAKEGGSGVWEGGKSWRGEHWTAVRNGKERTWTRIVLKAELRTYLDGAGEETRKGGWTEADSKLADCRWAAPFAVRSAYNPFSK